MSTPWQCPAKDDPWAQHSTHWREGDGPCAFCGYDWFPGCCRTCGTPDCDAPNHCVMGFQVVTNADGDFGYAHCLELDLHAMGKNEPDAERQLQTLANRYDCADLAERYAERLHGARA